MFFTDEIKPQPWKIILFGKPGTRKSSFAALAPNPYFINLEDGLKWVKCKKSEHIKNLNDVVKAMEYLKNLEDCKTVVFDGGDTLEYMAYQHAVKKACLSQKEAASYGKGWSVTKQFFKDEIIPRIEDLSKTKNVIFICHEDLKTVEDSKDSDYLEIGINLNKNIAKDLESCFDAVLRIHLQTSVTEDNKIKTSGKYVMTTGSIPSYRCKNRFALEGTKDLDIKFYDHINNFLG